MLFSFVIPTVYNEYAWVSADSFEEAMDKIDNEFYEVDCKEFIGVLRNNDTYGMFAKEVDRVDTDEDRSDHRQVATYEVRENRFKYE